jgi:hypothetical protein
MIGQSSDNFYSSARFFGGVAIGYTALTEVDFVATAGLAYAPPEIGDFRRINVTRCLQLVSDASGVIETFQTSAAEIRLPANTITEATNDSGEGRLFFLKNSGTGNIIVKDYLGTTLWTVKQSGITIVVGNDNNNWDFYFTAKNIDFNNTTNGFIAVDVQTAIEEAKQNSEGFPRAGLPLISNGIVSNGEYVTYSELLANKRILFPVTIRLKELTWNNTNLRLGAFNFEIYKNGIAPANLIYTYIAPAGDRTVGFGYFVFPVNVDIAAGEYIYIKYAKPSGTSLSDLALVLWISRIP